MQTTTAPIKGFTPVSKAPKEWSWSYSKLKNWRTCALRHYHTDIAKTYIESTEQLDYGNMIHKFLEDAIMKGTPIPDEHAWIRPYVDLGKAVPNRKCEVQYTIDKNYQKTGWFAPNAWYRAKIDVLGIKGPVAVALDWKTGKPVNDSEQLMMAAVCIFVHHPEVQAVRTEFVWMKEGTTSRLDVRRHEVPGHLANILPDVVALKLAFDANNYPPNPGYLCRRYCPVVTCEHHGTLPQG